MLSRRSVILGAPVLAACATHAPTSDDTRAFLRRAIAAAGGEAALRRARVFAWTGNATINAGGRHLVLGVDTVVEPFVYARSETWLLSRGRDSARVMEITPGAGWAIVRGVRSALPDAQTIHERQQFALYGLMRLVTLLDDGVELTEPAIVIGGSRFLHSYGSPVSYSAREIEVRHPSAPLTTLQFDPDDRILAATNVVRNPDPNGPDIHQFIRFDGTIENGGVRWPRRISIFHGPPDEQPYFSLRLETFAVREHR